MKVNIKVNDSDIPEALATPLLGKPRKDLKPSSSVISSLNEEMLPKLEPKISPNKKILPLNKY